MDRISIIIISFFFVCNLSAQTADKLQTKSFYYDVDNFSLTSESMGVLAEFVEEIKKKPIEIIEIIGYTEKLGSPIYNQIRSKKRMNSIKSSIDTAMIIHQYKPTNMDYPPSFLYSYEDGYNWRKVDITYKYRIAAGASPNFIVSEKKENLKRTDSQENKITTTFENFKTPEEIAIEKYNSKLAALEAENIKNNIVEIEEKQADLSPHLRPEETGQISTLGKTQDEIDHMVIREKSSVSDGSKEFTHPNVGLRLSKIDVATMDNTIILINLNLQFDGDAPVVNNSSIQEIEDLVKFLKENYAIDAFIRGHVCCGDQMPLSKKRAKTVYNELIRRGISEERLRHQGFSNSIPAVFPEKTERDRAKNRRVDVIFSKTTRSNTPPPTVEEEKPDARENVFSTERTQLAVTVNGNENIELKTEGLSQDQIDNLLVTEKATTKHTSKKDNLDMESKLKNIDLSNLSHSVSLVILGLEFDNLDPILTEQSVKEIDDIYTFMNQNQQVQAFIRGHVCCGDNMKLSKKRAKYVWSELVKRGINSDRMRYQGFSNSLLLVNPEKNESDRAKNRRVDIIFSVK
jgi:outer membrane protein OmpA-like peptidoglycan-associated protein